jgi:iron-sulfur cluster assembly protein
MFAIEDLFMTETTTSATQLVNVTAEAAQEIKKLLVEETGKSGLRLAVKGGGCSGMSYGLAFDNAEDKDNITEVDGVKVFVDPKSAIYLKGVTLDFEGGLQGKGFILKNPNAKSSCGCGESFSV